MTQEQPNELEIIMNKDNTNQDNTNKDNTNKTVLVEEEYTEHSEALLTQWLKEAKDNSKAHNIKGRSFKKKHEWFGLPATLLPIVYSPIAGLLAGEPGTEIASVVVLVITGILSGIHTFFDFGRKSQKHFEYEARYSDLYTTIIVELSKKRELRIKVDRFVEMIQSKIDNLGANAPLL